MHPDNILYHDSMLWTVHSDPTMQIAIANNNYHLLCSCLQRDEIAYQDELMTSMRNRQANIKHSHET